MSAVKLFSWCRLGLFIKSDLVMNSSKIFTYSFTLFVVLFLYGLVGSTAFYRDNFHLGVFVFVLLFGGLWLTSNSFVDLHDQERKQNFLLLPASNLEKLLGRLLLTTIGYIVGVVSIFYIVSLLVAGFNWLVIGKASVIFKPMCKDIMSYFAVYIFFQSMYFFGAIYFKSSNFSKTFLCLCGLVCGFFLVASIIFWIFLRSDFSYGWEIIGLYNTAVRVILTIMIPPCAWLVAYLRLCESEI